MCHLYYESSNNENNAMYVLYNLAKLLNSLSRMFSFPFKVVIKSSVDDVL